MAPIEWKVRSSWSTSTETNGTLPESLPFHSAAAELPSTSHFVTGLIPGWGFKPLKRQSGPKTPSLSANFRSVDGLHLPRHVIHQHVLAQPLWRGEIGFSAAHLRDLLYELHEPE